MSPGGGGRSSARGGAPAGLAGLCHPIAGVLRCVNTNCGVTVILRVQVGCHVHVRLLRDEQPSLVTPQVCPLAFDREPKLPLWAMTMGHGLAPRQNDRRGAQGQLGLPIREAA